MTFGQVERLVGPLPYSAHEHRAWWANDNKSQALAWRAAGRHVASVNQSSGHVVFARVGQRLLAMATCIWHNTNIGAPRKRSLIAYDH
jgi:hypothetical protein